MNNDTRVMEQAPIRGTNRGMEPPDNVLEGGKPYPLTRLTLVTMLTRETYDRNAVIITR